MYNNDNAKTLVGADTGRKGGSAVSRQGRPSQRDRNPFPFSDTDKRYHTYDYYLRRTFGGKCAKIPLDAGLTCPNLDGTCGRGGCAFCSGRGSGDFALLPTVPLREQYDRGREALAAKWPVERCIPYLQAHTNTYAPTDRLRRIYEEVLTFPAVVGLNIATRADCLPDATVALLDELSHKTVLTVELGLQTVHDTTAAAIGRGHTLADFLNGYARLRAGAPRVRIGIHLILGLPGEDEGAMLDSVRAVAALCPDALKLHLLHVLRGTRLGAQYEAGLYTPMEEDDYIRTVVHALELLPPMTVIDRLTGDGAAADLLAPLWSRRKREVLAGIDKRLFAEDTRQGRLYSEPTCTRDGI